MGKHPTKCPNCGRGEFVGRVEVREVCVDVASGDVLRSDVVNPAARYECGACCYEWPRQTPITLTPEHDR